MLMIDMRNSTARITMREIAAAGRRYASSPIALSSFMAGVRLTPEVLLEGTWRSPAGAAGNFAFFRHLMLGLLPQRYDVHHLEALGGRFALRLAGIGRHGDFTTMAVNRRVVTLTGLPRDDASGLAIVDSSVRADVFLALWNGMLADLAETTLAHVAAARSAPSQQH
ncbi:hypothetical protein J6524_16470 [Bradyrhizobium sp. WSM 1738]|uniref:hypothetical protein n=1 Tax=Bradyrhizobium hereditatis TaxID=2821405 RepID=UPI001CE23BE3|nr:hypothetical protein [Bradyrhizobium hereditatis]MCA6116481.1 hypothetical protein [Bradyrhizobium hereditatis]